MFVIFVQVYKEKLLKRLVYYKEETTASFKAKLKHFNFNLFPYFESLKNDMFEDTVACIYLSKLT